MATPTPTTPADNREALNADIENLLRVYLSGLLPYLGIQGHPDEPVVDGISEIMINAPDDIWVEQYGQVRKLEVRLDPRTTDNLIVLLGNIARNIGGEGALFTVYHWGLRIAATMPPTSLNGISLCIRRKVKVLVPLEEYAESAAARPSRVIPDPDCKAAMLTWLRDIVAQRKTILVAGGTSSGKTTFLNALISSIPREERIITIEDSPELEPASENRVRFITSEQLHIDSRMLIKQCLRYRPDRIIVGEVRGAEALDMVDACNTGHDGSMTSIHANSPIEALERLETLVLRSGVPWPHAAIRQTVSRAIHYIIQMRQNANGQRAISEIIALNGMDGNGNYLYRNIHIPTA